jgi:hypothetical protein
MTYLISTEYYRVIQKVKTVLTQQLHFALDILFHPPYSLDLAPSDFHLFTHLKQFLGTCMGSNEEVKKTVKDWLRWTHGRFLQCRHIPTRHTT